ncbi:beta-galactosidase family protein [Mucilaginibacter sabulilitoris]|uniref:Beta-galactosidase family protein n=1 Tax=Mucilaginibacter sabulilitoris TaxID=1173583 RepID=A0ABZ0TGU6_9SPHI|nr:beta-galactosidase family protein [Mucilaginibacter sabulilitoris]WPU92233.1 beta-galactosidase family protein [Mucilaginibacter sabulilitoris]
MRSFNLFLLTAILLAGSLVKAQPKHQFSLGDKDFLLDGKPFQMISGELHYPRIPREAWRDRMKMAKAMGLNTIGTYVFWNLHEPQKGQFDFSGNNDIVEFIKIAQQEGLWVILRPSPYVCAEWEFGGYPYWLENEEGVIVRSKNAQYLREYENYIKELGKRLSVYQINHGGNILMVQIENEYGSYGADKEYLAINQKMFKDAGFDGLLYTCDPAADLVKGHLPGLLPAVNGLDNPAKVKELINQNHEGKGPYYIAEWYPAWFDWWGTKHHTVPADQYTGKLDSVLAAGISINMYMFHGGTTRGFMNGANYNDQAPFEPQISSYDYDAPLDEAGNPTSKFEAFRNVIQKHLSAGINLPAVPPAKPTISIPKIELENVADLNELKLKGRSSQSPLTFEDMKLDYGFMLYRTKVEGGKSGILKVKDLRDFAVVIINGQTVGKLDRRTGLDSINVNLPDGNVTLDILVENLGRINFGKYLLQNKKGIVGKVFFQNNEVTGWQNFPLPLKTVGNYKPKPSLSNLNTPVMKKGTFSLASLGDTYLNMTDWGKGVVWINGHNLGRYWQIGPQQTLYVPREWLHIGKNEILVFEVLKPENKELSAVSKPILDQLQ